MAITMKGICAAKKKKKAGKIKSPKCVLVKADNVYDQALQEAIKDELAELYPKLRCSYWLRFWDFFKSDDIIFCGSQSLTRRLIWLSSLFRRRVVLYHVPVSSYAFTRLAKHSKMVVVSQKQEQDDGYNCFPSPVLLSDLATSKRIERIWNRERLVSKRNTIGVTCINLDEKLLSKLVRVFDMLIEDMDLNVVFIPILPEDNAIMKQVVRDIRYSANAKRLNAGKYSPGEVLGLISKVDVLLTADVRGANCGFAVNKPVIGLLGDITLEELMGSITEEEIIFAMEDLSSEDLYSKIKVCLFHRESIEQQLSLKIKELKKEAYLGIKTLGEELCL